MDYTVTQAAERLNISRQLIHKMIRQGAFPNAFRVNPMAPHSQVRIPAADIEAIESTRQIAKPEK